MVLFTNCFGLSWYVDVTLFPLQSDDTTVPAQKKRKSNDDQAHDVTSPVPSFRDTVTYIRQKVSLLVTHV